MTGTWIGFAIIGVLTIGITVWVTNKAYSRKWEE